MGHLIEEPEYGNDCLCWPAGETPDQLLCFISGVQKCPGSIRNGPYGGAYILDQILPCVYTFQNVETKLRFERNAGGTHTTCAQLSGGVFVFGHSGLGQCLSSGPNQSVCLLGFTEGELGNYYVDTEPWPSTAKKLTDTYGMLPSEGTKTDPYIIQDEPPTTVVYRFQNRKYSTKLGIKFDYTV